MGALSHDQFAARVNEGGASRDLQTLTERSDTDPAHKGLFAVSFPKDPHGLEETHVDPVSRQDVIDHRQRMLADPTISNVPSAVQGGWTSAGKRYLDASRLIPGKTAALGQARRDKQKGMQDMEKGETVYTRRGYAQADVPRPKKVMGTPSSGFTVREVAKPKISPSRSAVSARRVAGRR